MQPLATHTALVVSASGQLRLESVPTPRPQEGEILVAPLQVGICGSDLDLMRGTRPLSTRILGHEGVAEVVAVGAGTPHFSVGQRVTFLPNNPLRPEDILGGQQRRSLSTVSARYPTGVGARHGGSP